MRPIQLAVCLSLIAASSAAAFELKPVGHIQIGDGEGYAEIVRYHAPSQTIMVTAFKTGTIERIDISDPARPTKAAPFDLSGGNVTSVAVNGDLIAASIRAESAGDPGTVIVFDAGGERLAVYPTGALPDSLAFSPDGRFLITANEGEPSEDYSVDPDGSFTIIDMAGGAATAKVTQVPLTGLDVPSGARIVKPGTSFAADAEPEYVTMSADSRTAYATLQENNALAIIDLVAGRVSAVVGLGYKNTSRQTYDMSDQDGGINMRRWPTLMMYQPDTLQSYQVNGVTYLVTANEGDSKDYDGFSEETRVTDLHLDPVAFPDAADLQKPENLGRLKTTKTLGDTDGDGDHDIIYAYGARSFSIWTADGELVFDSGNAFEHITARRTPEIFNANGSAAKLDDRSDDKGPEPEALAVGEIGGRHYAFIGMERTSGIFVYDITNPVDPHLVTYTLPDPRHSSPEGLEFVPAQRSPNGKPLLVAAFEVSGTVAVYEIGN